MCLGATTPSAQRLSSRGWLSLLVLQVQHTRPPLTAQWREGQPHPANHHRHLAQGVFSAARRSQEQSVFILFPTCALVSPLPSEKRHEDHTAVWIPDTVGRQHPGQVPAGSRPAGNGQERRMNSSPRPFLVFNPLKSCRCEIPPELHFQSPPALGTQAVFELLMHRLSTTDTHSPPSSPAISLPHHLLPEPRTAHSTGSSP